MTVPGAPSAGPACAGCGAAWPGGRTEFRATCVACGAWLHACRACAHFDPGAHYACRASATAEFVADKAAFNFCEEFTPGGAAGGTTRPKSRAEVEKLFPGLG